MKDVLIRALKTFWQTAAAELLANMTVLSHIWEEGEPWQGTVASLGIAALAAGFSAAWNAVISPWLSKLSKGGETLGNG